MPHEAGIQARTSSGNFGAPAPVGGAGQWEANAREQKQMQTSSFYRKAARSPADFKIYIFPLGEKV